MIHFLRRNWAFAYPEKPAKSQGALRIGLLGASNIAPLAVIAPAKSHPDVIIAAVAARDEKRANAYAKLYGIPIVHTSYQELIDDPSIDAIYIPLPNGLHYEWAIKALRANKHVLLEKPSTSNASEAASLFRHPLLKQPNAPILLEAFHSRFHPVCAAFLEHVDKEKVVSAHATLTCPKGVFPETDIRFDYDIGGGVTMDMGAYTTLFLRLIFGTEPEECLEATPRLMPTGFDKRCDQAMNAKWRFPNGGIGTMHVDLSLRSLGPIPGVRLPMCEVVHDEMILDDQSLDSSGKEHAVVKKVIIWNMIMPVIWHRIDIEKKHTIRKSATKETLKQWTTTEYEKAYTWKDEAREGQGHDSWSTYRHQLEQFVHKIKGSGSPSGIWMDNEDSIKQMTMIDSAYKKAGLPLRPTRSYQEAL
ncbi:related to Oxidoreductase [Rhynchosporium secalis]|uniref:D-xylose 1-dehydrogenase (NADP(+), D-xylono-1,5-lactone-forming) n=1 Tax=Rhynchosporium secalis TaxID=38038 RepID=A0A1E1M9W5_RHYSE|nr:related to Oxidoreductase [Rhynchosporium secalis]